MRRLHWRQQQPARPESWVGSQAPPTWAFGTLVAANQCASSDHQRTALETLPAYCHMCPRTNHSGETGTLGTVWGGGRLSATFPQPLSDPTAAVDAHACVE
ncbi:hypothetical protein HaLaN_04360 [Haematococcus lacustris]|uniref:Uncharacterized protein n=1 Tax=Haematococcus lacustris TaxID=44745 RepID=A0A699YGP0_HAELA|nr:hypothetical protein HaLaN_04360 [Haematococcus lacustris]